MRVLMICHSYYEEDARLRREAEALIAAGHQVDVLALRRGGGEGSETINAVHLRRLPVRHIQGRSLGGYLYEYGAFFALASAATTLLSLVRDYSIVQVHSPPDFLVYSALPAKLRKAAVILDLHEAVPLFFQVRFPRLQSEGALKVLSYVERQSIAFANLVLTVNDSLRERLISLGISGEKVRVVLNAPDERLFDPRRYPRREFMADGVLRIIYAGSLTPLYEVDVALRALAHLLGEPNAAVTVDRLRFDILGRGDQEAYLRRLAIDLGLKEVVTFHGRLPLERVPELVAQADVGIAPTRSDRYTELSMSTKVLEYLAMGKPAVASALPTVRRYLGGAALYYTPGDPQSLALAIRHLVTEPALRKAQAVAAAHCRDQYSWTAQAREYVRVVEALVGA